MLKAFSKVFHKTQGSPEEQLKGGAAHGHASGVPLQPAATPPQPVPRHTSERVQAAGLGVDVSSLGSQRRNAGEDNLPRPFAADGGMRSAKEPSRRVSLQQRIEQQIQPRLHMKSPSQGTDGRFALTADNIDWHLRMLPAMKESKYDRILRYVQAQQQNVSAAADPAMQQQLRDIDSSLLMGGHMGYEYMDPAYPMAEQQILAQQGVYQQQNHAHTGVLVRPAYGAPAGVPIIVPQVAGISQGNVPGKELDFGISSHAFQPMNNGVGFMLQQEQRQQLAAQGTNNSIPPPVNHTNTNHTTNTAGTVQRNIDNTAVDVSRDNEEDDNTPLAVINFSTSAGAAAVPGTGAGAAVYQQEKTPMQHMDDLNKMSVLALEKYVGDSLDIPLPDVVSPNHGARMSIMSFGSNIAVQLNSENYILSRSHSLSNPQSASAYGSHQRATPVARSPTGQDAGAQYMPAYSGSARQSSLHSAQVQPRASMDALAAYARDRGFSNALSDGDDHNLSKAALSHRNSGENSQQYQQGHALAANTLRHSKPGLGSNIRDERDNNASDDDDDDAPLAQPGNRDSVLDLNKTSNSKRNLSGSFSDIALRVTNQGEGDSDSRNNSNSNSNSGSGSGSSSHDSDRSADEQDIGDEQDVVRSRQAVNGPTDGSFGAAAVAVRYEEEEEEDNQPLMSLSRKLSSQMHVSAPTQPLQLYVNTTPLVGKANGDVKHDSGGDKDSEDDQPLSGLLMQPLTGSDDLGSLPLPMPRRVIDPDAIGNIDEMINETALPVRSSLSESPTSPMILPRGAVRKHSLLLHSSKPGAKDTSSNKDVAFARATGTDRLSLTERTASAYAQSLSLNKRRSNVSAFAQHISAVKTSSTSESDDDMPIVSNAAEAARIHKENGWGRVEPNKETLERPWTKQHRHSASTSSLNGSKWSQRGSTLGQQLTDELQKVREVLARSRCEEKSERRSWQVGDRVPQPPVKRPWVKHQENTASESALLKNAPEVDANIAASASAHVESDNPHPSSWSFAEKARPASTQYHQRASRWLPRSFGGAANNSNGMGADDSELVLPQSQSKDDVAAVSTSPQSTKSFSFSTKLNMKLGKLKRSLKPAMPESTA